MLNDELTTHLILLLRIELEDWSQLFEWIDNSSYFTSFDWVGRLVSNWGPIRPSLSYYKLPQDLEGVQDEGVLHSKARIHSIRSGEIILGLKSLGFRLQKWAYSRILNNLHIK